MDTLAHIVSGMLLCSRSGIPGGRDGAVDSDGHRKRFDWTLWAAGGFAAMPDFLSFGILFIQRTMTGGMPGAKPELHEIPSYVFFNYQCTHSLLIAGLVTALVWWKLKPLRLPILAWPLHILCDIPMHSREYFPTPVFYPLSNYTFDGWSFGQYHAIIYSYWIIILLLFATVLVMRSRRSNGKARNRNLGPEY